MPNELARVRRDAGGPLPQPSSAFVPPPSPHRCLSSTTFRTREGGWREFGPLPRRCANRQARDGNGCETRWGGGTRPHPHPLGLKPPITRTHHPWRVLISPTPAIRMGNGYPSSNPHPPRHVGITPHYEASPSTPPLLTVPSSLPTQLPHRRY
jgi:hypothetical protein